MNNLIIPSVSIQQRMEVLYKELSATYGDNNVHEKVLRGFGLLKNDGAGPKIQLCKLQDNKSAAGASYPAQILLNQTDGYAFVGSRITVVKAATAAALAYATRFPYADLTEFPTTGGENNSVQSFFSAGEVELNVNSKPAMQPLAISQFEFVPEVQSAAAVVPATRSFNSRFYMHPEDRYIAGGNQNFFEFNLDQADTAAISPSDANYVCVETVGYVVLNRNGEFAQKAMTQCI